MECSFLWFFTRKILLRFNWQPRLFQFVSNMRISYKRKTQLDFVCVCFFFNLISIGIIMIPRKQQKFFKRQSQNGINASFNGKSAHNFITKTCAHTENSLTVSPVNNDADVCECGYMLPSPATLTKCDCKQHPVFPCISHLSHPITL